MTDIAPILKALANPVRMELLRLLQQPKALAEIRLQPSRLEDGSQPTRPMNRVTVRQHLKQLIEIGAVEKIPGFRDGREVDLYGVAAEQMFLLGQELMSVGRVQVDQRRVQATRELDPDAVPGLGNVGLALVNGAYEGKWFGLRPATMADTIWTIGRDTECSVPLTFDPFVSALHAEIHRVGSKLIVRPAPGATNALYVDWEAVGDEDERTLYPGTVIGLGRSTLVFRA